MVASAAGGEGKCKWGWLLAERRGLFALSKELLVVFSRFQHGWRFTSSHVVLKDYNKKLSDDAAFVMEFQHSQQEPKPEAAHKKKYCYSDKTEQVNQIPLNFKSELVPELWKGTSDLAANTHHFSYHVLSRMEDYSPGTNCFFLVSCQCHLSGSV